jgi:GTP cyclohydrolase II
MKTVLGLSISRSIQVDGMFFAASERSTIAVERAMAELRAGRSVLLTRGRKLVLVMAVEALDPGLAGQIDSIASGTARLVLTSARLRHLGLERPRAGSIALPWIDVQRVQRLAQSLDGRIDAPVALVDTLDEAALDLARLALLLPAVIVATVAAKAVSGSPFIRASAKAVRDYRSERMSRLEIVSRAPVPLEGAPDTEFVVFRGGEGLREQIAVVIGRPDLTGPVTVRLHSACLTGDLFGSLKCDCGDQLRRTVKTMVQSGGGILLYLDQEGRGNGIANKMRAYALQADGLDTYDADETLGFEHDQRHFDFAARMLQSLGVEHVRVMTNNPEKIEALRRAGLDVVSDHRIQGRATDENVRYLAAKRDRAGHYIDFDAMAANARPTE